MAIFSSCLNSSNSVVTTSNICGGVDGDAATRNTATKQSNEASTNGDGVGDANNKNNEATATTFIPKQPPSLTHVGKAVYDKLRQTHSLDQYRCWNVSDGQIVGKLHQTPSAHDSFVSKEDPPSHHSDWFPLKLKEIIERTQLWCDIVTLTPPDGYFLTCLKNALKTLDERSTQQNRTIVVRIMFGNILGMPSNCNAITEELTKDFVNSPQNTKLRLWVGAWRQGQTWNHAKMIAVDGKYLHTGGHNMWDEHYLQHNPVHDLSLELYGNITHDAHMYVNAQWDFIQRKQSTRAGQMADHIPDGMPLLWKTRVTITEYPSNGIASEFPPMYHPSLVVEDEESVINSLPTSVINDTLSHVVPILSIGRYGSITTSSTLTHPADDAIIAMIDSAKHCIKLHQQDIGPMTYPQTKKPLPGLTWPDQYLAALARAVWQRGVDIEIIVSNCRGAFPGNVQPTPAGSYGHGWTCDDIAAKLIQHIKRQHSKLKDSSYHSTYLRNIIRDNIRICYIKQAQGPTYHKGNTPIALHTKMIIVDDCSTYIGSQNMYMCDLAEWGVVIDNKEQTQQFLQELWIPSWNCSYKVGKHKGDLNIDRVMDRVNIIEEEEDDNPTDSTATIMMYPPLLPRNMSRQERRQMKAQAVAIAASVIHPRKHEQYKTMGKLNNKIMLKEFYESESDDDSSDSDDDSNDDEDHSPKLPKLRLADVNGTQHKGKQKHKKKDSVTKRGISNNDDLAQIIELDSESYPLSEDHVLSSDALLSKLVKAGIVPVGTILRRVDHHNDNENVTTASTEESVLSKQVIKSTKPKQYFVAVQESAVENKENSNHVSWEDDAEEEETGIDVVLATSNSRIDDDDDDDNGNHRHHDLFSVETTTTITIRHIQMKKHKTTTTFAEDNVSASIVSNKMSSKTLILDPSISRSSSRNISRSTSSRRNTTTQEECNCTSTSSKRQILSSYPSFNVSDS